MVALHQAANIILQSHGCFQFIDLYKFFFFSNTFIVAFYLWSRWSNTLLSHGFYFISVPVNRYKQAFLEIFFFLFFYGWWNHRTHKNVNDVPMMCFKCCVSSVYIYTGWSVQWLRACRFPNWKSKIKTIIQVL